MTTLLTIDDQKQPNIDATILVTILSSLEYCSRIFILVSCPSFFRLGLHSWI